MSGTRQFDDGSGPVEENEVEVVDEDDVVEEVEGVEGEEDGEDVLVEADAMVTGSVTFQPVRDDAQGTFTEHQGSQEEEVAVFCVRVKDTGSGLLAATGGQDDKARVWNVVTGATVFVCTGHQESVTSCEWSQDGAFLATGDVNGVVKVWSTQNWTAVDTCNECESDTEWLEWHPLAPALLAGFREGTVWLWQVTDNSKRFFPCFNSPATVGRILPDGMRACVGYGDGMVRILHLKYGAVEVTISGQGSHTAGVTSLDFVKNEIITGSFDGTAKIVKNNMVVLTLKCGQGPSEDQEGDTVLARLCPTDPLAATGTGSGTLAVWDTRTSTNRHSIKHPNGITALCWSQVRKQHVYTACQDGVLRLWDCRSGQLVQEWHGHKSLIQDFCLDREEKLLVTASDDGTAKVFSVPAPAT